MTDLDLIASFVPSTPLPETNYFLVLFSTPQTIVSSIAAGLSVVLFVLNTVLTRLNLKNELRRKVMLSFFDKTVTRAFTEFVDFGSEALRSYRTIRASYSATGVDKAILEAELLKIDNSFKLLELDTFLYISAYDSKNSVKLSVHVEAFYDAIQSQLSSLTNPNLSEPSLANIHRQTTDTVQNYVAGILGLCRKLEPK